MLQETVAGPSEGRPARPAPPRAGRSGRALRPPCAGRGRSTLDEPGQAREHRRLRSRRPAAWAAASRTPASSSFERRPQRLEAPPGSPIRHRAQHRPPASPRTTRILRLAPPHAKSFPPRRRKLGQMGDRLVADLRPGIVEQRRRVRRQSAASFSDLPQGSATGRHPAGERGRCRRAPRAWASGCREAVGEPGPHVHHDSRLPSASSSTSVRWTSGPSEVEVLVLGAEGRAVARPGCARTTLWTHVVRSRRGESRY